MKIIYILILALVFGAFGAWIIKDQIGFVLIAWDNNTLEMRLWIASALFLLYTLGIFVLAWIVFKLKSTGRAFSSWSANRGNKKSRSQTINGLIALTEGHWDKAEQLFIKATEKSDSRLINYLLAAKSAHEQKNYAVRDDYLQSASKYEPSASIAVSVTQAELQYESRQYEQALATLTELWSKAPKHPFVLKLLAKCYFQLKDWKNLYELLPKLKKLKVLEPNVYQELEQHCLIQQLRESAKEGGELLQQHWQSLANDYKKQIPIIAVYSQLLIEQGCFAEAETILRSALKRGYQSDLIYWYGHAAGRDNQSQLQFAESFKSEAINDHKLHLALGLLSYRAELWGKAKQYALASIQANPNSEAYELLALTQGQLNESNRTIVETLQHALGCDKPTYRLSQLNDKSLLTDDSLTSN